MPEPESLVDEVSATVPLRFAPGSFIVALGGVLSTRMLVTAADAPSLPAASIATARRSCRPSETVVVSKLTPYGNVVSVAMGVQLLWPAGERWKTTCATPAGSDAEPVRLTLVPRRFRAGSSWVAVGPVLSTLTVRTGPLNEL